MAQEEYIKGLAYEGNKLSKDNTLLINYFANKTGLEIPNQEESIESSLGGGNVFEQLKNYINSGLYDLNGILDKINILWVSNRLTDEEAQALIELARNHANPENSYAPLQKQIDLLFENQKEFSNQLKEIAEKLNTLIGGGEVEPVPEPEPSEEYPEYVNPTGAHDAYYKDNKVTYNGKKYICIAPDGVACVWSPDVYPQYWKEVKE